MKKHIKSYLVGFVSAAVLFTATPVFAETSKTIDAVFGLVKLVVNGQAVDKETLAYNGTTYVPLRAAAEILGMEVGYNDATKTATLTSKADATPTPSNSAKEYGDGQYKVGVDVPAGEYRIVQKDEKYNAFYTITTDANGKDIVAIEGAKGALYATVKDGQYIKIQNGIMTAVK